MKDTDRIDFIITVSFPVEELGNDDPDDLAERLAYVTEQTIQLEQKYHGTDVDIKVSGRWELAGEG